MRDVRYTRDVRSSRNAASPSTVGGGQNARLGPPQNGGALRWIGLAAVAALAVAALVLLPRLTASSSAAAKPLSLLVAADVSASQSKEERKSYCNLLDAVVEEVLPPQRNVAVWWFDNKAGKMYEGQPRTPNELYALQDDLMAYTNNAKGTSPANALPEIIAQARAKSGKGEPVAVLLLWDGEDENAPATKQLVNDLAGVSTLKAVWVVGIPTEEKAARSQVEKQLAILGDKLIVTNRYDAERGLDEFRARVRAKG